MLQLAPSNIYSHSITLTHPLSSTISSSSPLTFNYTECKNSFQLENFYRKKGKQTKNANELRWKLSKMEIAPAYVLHFIITWYRVAHTDTVRREFNCIIPKRELTRDEHYKTGHVCVELNCRVRESDWREWVVEWWWFD